MWDATSYAPYSIKGTNIYDSNGTTVLRTSYPIGEWFKIKTTYYGEANKIDIDLIQADGTVINLKRQASYTLPTGGVKQVRFNTQYTSTSPTYRDSIYIDNINIYKENPTASIEGGTDYKSIDFVKLSFTNTMTSSTLTASNITVSNVSNYIVSYDDITQTATIQFNTPLDVATNYSISLIVV